MPAIDTDKSIEITVFDFDGTITTKDTFALFLRYYAGTPKSVSYTHLTLPTTPYV